MGCDYYIEYYFDIIFSNEIFNSYNIKFQNNNLTFYFLKSNEYFNFYLFDDDGNEIDNEKDPYFIEKFNEHINKCLTENKSIIIFANKKFINDEYEDKHKQCILNYFKDYFCKTKFEEIINELVKNNQIFNFIEQINICEYRYEA